MSKQEAQNNHAAEARKAADKHTAAVHKADDKVAAELHRAEDKAQVGCTRFLVCFAQVRIGGKAEG
jgi:hypothetical protein